MFTRLDVGATEVIELYQYRATCTRVVDGDTADFDVDLGFGITFSTRFRFAYINAPEVKGEEKEQGNASTQYVRERIEGKEVLIATDKDKKGKYGRYIASVYYDGKYESLNQEMVRVGMAKPAKY